jgi:hypothetical protein
MASKMANFINKVKLILDTEVRILLIDEFTSAKNGENLNLEGLKILWANKINKWWHEYNQQLIKINSATNELKSKNEDKSENKNEEKVPKGYKMIKLVLNQGENICVQHLLCFLNEAGRQIFIVLNLENLRSIIERAGSKMNKQVFTDNIKKNLDKITNSMLCEETINNIKNICSLKNLCNNSYDSKKDLIKAIKLG